MVVEHGPHKAAPSPFEEVSNIAMHTALCSVHPAASESSVQQSLYKLPGLGHCMLRCTVYNTNEKNRC